MFSDPAAEKAVLSILYNHGKDAYIDAADIVQQPKTFSVKYNEIFYCCLQHAFEKLEINKPDIATIYSAAKDIGFEHILRNSRCESHIEQIIEFETNPENLRKYAAKIRKLHIGKTINEHLEYAQEEIEDITGEERVSEILGVAEQKIFDLSECLSDKSDEPVKFAEIVEEYVNDRINNVVDQVGISTGYPVFDSCIGGGCRPGSVSVVAARAKNFKSGFALNVGLHATDMRIPVLYMDTELQFTEQLPRCLANLSGVPIDEIETGKFSKSAGKLERVQEASKKIQDCFYHKNISGMPFEEQLSIMRRWIHKDVGVNLSGQAKPCLLVYDYLKLMDQSVLRSVQETQALGFILTGLHNFSVKYNIPIFSFVQLNRDGINRESTDVIAQSDRILWFCSNLSILKQKSPEEIADEESSGIKDAGNYKLIPVACRHGEGMQAGDYINLRINKPCFQIREGRTNAENRSGFVNDSEEAVEF